MRYGQTSVVLSWLLVIVIGDQYAHGGLRSSSEMRTVVSERDSEAETAGRAVM